MTELVVAPKKAIAIAVMIAFIVVCVLAPFGAAHAIVGVSTAAVTILIAALAAAGITFTTTGAFDTLEEYIESLLQEYAQDNNIPFTSVFNGTSWQASAAGKILLNNRFTKFISAFSTWLKYRFSLVDNTTKNIITPGATLNGMTTYSLPLTISRSNGLTFEFIYLEGDSSQFAIFQSGNTSFNIWIISESAGQYRKIRSFNNQIEEITDNSLVAWNGGLYGVRDQQGYGNSNYDPNDIFEKYSYNDIVSALDNDSVIDVNNIGIGIKTGSIDILSDRTNYTDTSGAILDVNAPWSIPISGVIDTIPDAWSSVQDDTTVYTLDLEAEAVIEQQLPLPSDIENLPGASIPIIPDIDGEPWHLEFSNLWHYVAQWISDMSAGGAVIWNTCIQAPPPIINLVFVGIVLAMWFGAIKILR